MPSFFGFSPYAFCRCGSRRRSGRRSAQILFGPACRFAQCGRCVHRPIGIAQHGAGQEHKISLALRDDGVGLRRLGDEPNRGRCNAGFAADSGGKAEPENREQQESSRWARVRPRKHPPDPRRARAAASQAATDSSGFQPPSAQSVAEMRTNSGKRSGHTPRTASTTSSTRRMRLSKLPP